MTTVSSLGSEQVDQSAHGRLNIYAVEAQQICDCHVINHHEKLGVDSTYKNILIPSKVEICVLGFIERNH